MFHRALLILFSVACRLRGAVPVFLGFVRRMVHRALLILFSVAGRLRSADLLFLRFVRRQGGTRR